MSLAMTKAERESFLAGEHVGVLAVSGDRIIAVPIWYAYEPGGDVRIWMDRGSRKDLAIRKAGRFSLVAQTEERPYKYVSVEGPVVANDEPPTRDEAIEITQRYLPRDLAMSYVDDTLSERSILVRMRPERWLSNDHSK